MINNVQLPNLRKFIIATSIHLKRIGEDRRANNAITSIKISKEDQVKINTAETSLNHLGKIVITTNSNEILLSFFKSFLDFYLILIKIIFNCLTL